MLFSKLGWLAVAVAVKADDFFRVDFDINRGNSVHDMSPDNKPMLVKRDAFTMEVTNEQTFYLAELQLGSNKDKVGVLVDTGSSDLWVMSHDVECFAVSESQKRRVKRDDIGIHVGNINIDPENKFIPSKTVENKDMLSDLYSELGLSTDDPYPGGGGSGFGSGSGSGSDSEETNTCTSYGSFATADSSSFKANSSAPAFQIQYADGTEADGVWGYDDVSISNTTVNSLSLAVVNVTSSNIGVLGIGLPGLEVTYSSSTGDSSPYTYENLPIKLANQGVIGKAAFSLYLGDSDSKTGTILFGAVDHAKYSGTLKSVPIVNSLSAYFKNPIRLEINVDNIKLNSSSSATSVTSNGYTALLDTGSTLSYFPEALFQKVGTMLNLDYSEEIGAYLIDCSVDSDVSLTFDFSGVEINAPLNNFVLQATRNTCYFGILSQGTSTSSSSVAESDYILLGDNFLRNAYVVYDLEDFTISLAQVKYTDEENVEAIKSSIPSAEVVSTAATTAFTGGSEASSATGVVNVGSSGSGSSSSSGSSGSGSSSSDSDSSKDSSATMLLPSIFLCLLLVVVTI